jgi:citrate lyase alpha subunit
MPLRRKRGGAGNPKRQDLANKMRIAGIQTASFAELRDLSPRQPGIVKRPPGSRGRIVAAVEYRDGTAIDLVRSIDEAKGTA